MTKEEAIKILPDMKGAGSEWDKAIDLAIFALKAQMDGDIISRQNAIDAVEKSRRLNHHQDGKEACAHEYEHRHFLKILRDLPPAQPELEELDFVQPHKKICVQLEIPQPEQKTGKWIWKLDEGDPDRSMMLMCSICGNGRNEVGTYNFCHICGTKMINPRGEQDGTD